MRGMQNLQLGKTQVKNKTIYELFTKQKIEFNVYCFQVIMQT